MALVLSALSGKSLYINHGAVTSTVDDVAQTVELSYSEGDQLKVAHLVGIGDSVKVLGVTITLNQFFKGRIAKIALDGSQSIVINTEQVYKAVTDVTGGKLVARRVYNFLNRECGINRQDIDRLVGKASEFRAIEGDETRAQVSNITFSIKNGIVYEAVIS
ncbi:VHS1098 protein [Vibrio phage 1]|nr:VHS1098 protein [Vibrio phage 1]